MTLNIPNLDRLISHLEGLPEEKFDMRNFYTRDGRMAGSFGVRGTVMHSCRTAACIAGWIFALDQTVGVWGGQAYAWLGLPELPGNPLFEPPGYSEPGRYPLSRAIRTLKHMRSEYLRTGQVVVDWNAPELDAKPAWTAPKAVEQTKPALPAEIVRFLRPADLEVVS